MTAATYKKIAFLAPRADLSREAFLHHWETVHGPVVASAPDYGRWRRRYVQNHIVAAGPFGRPPSFGGMAVFWLPSANEDTYARSSTYLDHVRPDELNFIDMDATVSMTAVEEVLVDGSGPAKLVVLLPRATMQGGATPVLPPGAAAGHAVSRVVEGSMRLPGARPVPGPEIGEVHEILFASMGALEEACGDRAVQAAFDRGTDVVSFVAREHVFFGEGAPSPVPLSPG